MTPDQKFLAIGIYINSALYLSAVFTAGLWTGNALAWKLAIATFGTCYLAYVAQVTIPELRGLNIGLVIASVVLGMLAGLSLLR